MCNNCPGCYQRMFVQKEMCQNSPMYKKEQEDMSPLEKKINHILLDDDISDVSLSQKDMNKNGIGLVSDSDLIKFAEGLRQFYS